MSPRLSWLLACYFPVVAACAGKAQSSPSTDGGAPGASGPSATAGASGAYGVAGGPLRPPQVISEDPETLGPSPVACVGTPAPDATILRACVLAAGCAATLRPAPLSDCIAKALPASSAFSACLRDAVSCAEAAVCTGTGAFTAPCPSPGRSSCVGTKVVYCDSIPPYFEDCAVRGVSCLESPEAAIGASCGVEPCSGTTDGWVCDGTRRVSCQDGVPDDEDCAAAGLDCVATADGAICRQKAGGCSTFGSGTCDTPTAGSYCDNDGRTQLLDCAPLGFTCQLAPTQKHGIACLAPSCTPPDAAQCFEECDGPVAHLCVGGQRLSLDCPSYGFQTCILENRADVGDRARCGK